MTIPSTHPQGAEFTQPAALTAEDYERLGADPEIDGDMICCECGDFYACSDDRCEDTGICDPCAQVLLPKMREAIRAAAALARENAELRKENEGLLELTALIDEHPEGYEGPCMCKLCMSYADG